MTTPSFDTMLDDCENASDLLSTWECQFVDSLQRQLAEDKALTLNQEEMLEKIWHTL